ncbi:MAG: glycoside hydrolase family 3 N-terminal domain-containing protein [Bdellovibrio sp.]
MNRNLLIILVVTFHSICWSRDLGTKALGRSGELKISAASCNHFETELGQLFYVNVDGHGPQGAPPTAVDPAYKKMVKDLQIGGVLPHPGSGRYEDQRKDYNDMQSSTDLPLMIGVDYNGLTDPTSKRPKPLPGYLNYHNPDAFGLGWYGGILNEFRDKPANCLDAEAFLNAFLHKAVGLNQGLGPTLDSYGGSDTSPSSVKTITSNFDQLGVSTTMKHFPFVPDNFNLHSKNADTRLSPEEVDKKINIFKASAGLTDFAMSTHLIDSKIDSEVATFSKVWVNKLRNEVGFKGILMTDGLFMLKECGAACNAGLKETLLKSWPQDQAPLSHELSIFAAKSILAGHDMIELEGTPKDTYKVFNNLLKIACGDSKVGQGLRARIDESYQRIKKWKMDHQAVLRQKTDIPASLVYEAMDLRADKVCADSPKFADFKQKVLALKINSLTRLSSGVETTKPGNPTTGVR